MDRGEQAIQKIQTKTEYKEGEARVRERMTESESKSKEKTTSAVTVEQQESTLLSVRIRQQLPDLINNTGIENPSVTSSVLLNASDIAIVQESNTPISQNRTSNMCLITGTPRILPRTPLDSRQPVPRRALESTPALSRDTPTVIKDNITVINKTPKILPIAAPTQQPVLFEVTESTHVTEDVRSTPEYQNEARIALTEMFQTENLREEIKQYCADEFSYDEMIGRFITEVPQKTRAPKIRAPG